MREVERLISLNEDKLSCLRKYADCNEMMFEMLEDGNMTALKNLARKKSALVTTIDLLDENMVAALGELKLSEGIEDMADIDVAKHPEFKELKHRSLSVLRLMVEVKRMDEDLKLKVEEGFEKYRNSDGKFDSNRLEKFTKDYFND